MPSPESARDFVQLIVERTALCAFLFVWQHDVGYLQRWRLTRQRKHLVHGDPGSDRSIAQAGFANRFFHAFSAYGCHIREDGDQMFFSFCYALCLAFSDAHDGVIAHAVASGDAINTGVRLSEFYDDSAVGFGARPEQRFFPLAGRFEKSGCSRESNAKRERGPLGRQNMLSFNVARDLCSKRDTAL